MEEKEYRVVSEEERKSEQCERDSMCTVSTRKGGYSQVVAIAFQTVRRATANQKPQSKRQNMKLFLLFYIRWPG